MRHGEATHNVDGAARGEAAYYDSIHFDSELTEEGNRQVRVAGLSLPPMSTFHAVYCSPLYRCRQTLCGAAQTDFADRQLVTLDDRLMEPQGAHPCNQRIGAAVLRATVPATWNMDGVADRNPYDAGVESRVAFRQRIIEWTAATIGRHTYDHRILVVAHHDWIRDWFQAHQGRSVSLRNAEIVRVAYCGGSKT
jgi:broad specificity phosphatase PhoE